MSLSTELSGVQAAQSDINTIGNNIANVNTTGFKGTTAEFADLYGNAVQANTGQGVYTASLAQSFTEGTVAQTGQPLDAAINGNGFFLVQTGSGVAYTRDGSFQINQNGDLVDAAGNLVLGFPATPSAGGSTTGQPQPIEISSASIPASATTQLTLAVNLPSTDAAIDTTTTPFSTSNSKSYDESTTTSVYDNLGTNLSLTTYFTRVSGSGTQNQWQTHYTLTNPAGTVVASGAGPTLSFNGNGQLTSGSGTIAVSNLPDGAAPLNVALRFTGSTLSNLSFGVNSVSNNGNGGGTFTGVQIAANGQITGQYSNGGTKVLGTIALANFANPQGLIPISGNLWEASQASGQQVTGTPGTGTLGELESGALEGSNVDLSTQLVNLIVAQQAYQANVQGINIDQQDMQRLLTIQ
jgi:flagellar hook protein FlgE